MSEEEHNESGEGFESFNYEEDEEHEEEQQQSSPKQATSPSQKSSAPSSPANRQPSSPSMRPTSTRSTKMLAQFSSRPSTNTHFMEKFEHEKSDYSNDNVPVDDRVRILVNTDKNNEVEGETNNADESFESFGDEFDNKEEEIEPTEEYKNDLGIKPSDSHEVQELKKALNSDKQLIAKLKKNNQGLKEQLVQLNQIVEEQLEQNGVKIQKPKPTVKTVLVGNDQELKLLRKQHEIDKKTIEKLQKQLFSEGNPERIKLLVNKMSELTKQLEDLEKENKSLKIIQREQSKALETSAGVQDKTIDVMKNESRFQSGKIEQLKDKIKELEEVVNQKNKMLGVHEQKAKNLETILKRKNLTEDGVTKIDELTKQIEELSKENDKLKKDTIVMNKSKEVLEKKAKMISYQSKQEVKKFSQENTELRMMLEKREKDIRASNMILKQNNLTQHMITISPLSTPNSSSDLFATNQTSTNQPTSGGGSSGSQRKVTASPSPTAPKTKTVTKTTNAAVTEHKKIAKKNNIQTLGEKKKSITSTAQEILNTVEEAVDDEFFGDDFAGDDFDDSEEPPKQSSNNNEESSIFAPSF